MLMFYWNNPNRLPFSDSSNWSNSRQLENETIILTISKASQSQHKPKDEWIMTIAAETDPRFMIHDPRAVQTFHTQRQCGKFKHLELYSHQLAEFKQLITIPTSNIFLLFLRPERTIALLMRHPPASCLSERFEDYYYNRLSIPIWWSDKPRDLTRNKLKNYSLTSHYSYAMLMNH